MGAAVTDLYTTLAAAASGDLYLADCPLLFAELRARGCRMYAQHDSKLTMVHESVFLDVGAVRVHVQRTRALEPWERRARLEAMAAEAMELREDPVHRDARRGCKDGAGERGVITRADLEELAERVRLLSIAGTYPTVALGMHPAMFDALVGFGAGVMRVDATADHGAFDSATLWIGEVAIGAYKDAPGEPADKDAT